MKPLHYLIPMLFLTSCENKPQQQKDIALPPNPTAEIDQQELPYTDEQLEVFLDSIGGLPTETWAAEVAFAADSVFSNQQHKNKVISPADFAKLKQSIIGVDENKRTIDVKTAKNIFGKMAEIDSDIIEEGEIPITIFSFDENVNDFNEFGICLGYIGMNWECTFYIFRRNTLIAQHEIYHRYGLEVEHFKDIDGNTVIYYKQNFGSGVGIWQFNYNFYKLHDNKVVPVLNILADGNLNARSGHNYNLESTVINTTPLTIKMVYNHELFDTNDSIYRVVDDSTMVQYKWDVKTFSFVGNYEQSKISKLQILTYYNLGNQLLFINAYNQVLKEKLKTNATRHAVLFYLSDVKDYYDKKQSTR